MQIFHSDDDQTHRKRLHFTVFTLKFSFVYFFFTFIGKEYIRRKVFAHFPDLVRVN